MAPSEIDAGRVLFDFRDPLAVAEWSAIDDRVMGGISLSRMRHDPAGHAVFEGEVSLERHGGFASVRSRPAARGLPGAGACLIEVRGDGRRYKLSLVTADGLDGMNYQYGFAPMADAWQTIRLPLAMFRAAFRGRVVPDAPPLEPAHIRQVGLLIGDRQAGRFALAVRRIGLG